MPSYRITAPDGKRFRVTGDSPPTEEELLQIYQNTSGASPTSTQETKGAGKFFRPFMRGVENELVPFSEKAGQKIIPGDYQEQKGEEGLLSKIGYGTGFLVGSLPSFAATGGVAGAALKLPKIANIISKLSKGGKIAQFLGKNSKNLTSMSLLGAAQETENPALSPEGLAERAGNVGSYTATGAAFDWASPYIAKGFRKLFGLKSKEAVADVTKTATEQKDIKLLPEGKKKVIITPEPQPKPLDPLIQEARKYKSAEEFVNSRPMDKIEKAKSVIDEVFSGTITEPYQVNLVGSRASLKGLKPTSDIDILVTTTDKGIKEMGATGLATPKQLELMHKLEDKLASKFSVRDVREAGIDVMFSTEGEIKGRPIIRNISKSQLTDIYNQAKGLGETTNRYTVLPQYATEKPFIISEVSSPGYTLREIIANTKKDAMGRTVQGYAGDIEAKMTSEVNSIDLKKILKNGVTSNVDDAAFQGTQPIPLKQGKYAGSINLDKLNIDDKAKEQIRKAVSSYQEQGLAKTEQESLEMALGNQVFYKYIPKEEANKIIDAFKQMRESMAAQASKDATASIDGLRKFIETVKTAESQANFAGRLLYSYRNTINPNETPIVDSVIKKLVDFGAQTDDILKAAEGLNWDNANEVTAFYRKFVKPTFWETVTEGRYINMLSSPNTHIVNTASNLLQATVMNPGTKLFTGAVDFIGSKLTGAERKYYASEIKPYYRGMLNAVGDAGKNFINVMKGNQFVERPDMSFLPTNSPMTSWGTPILRLLDASDSFFRTLIAGGEKEAIAFNAAKRGMSLTKEEIEKEALSRAKYFVFREGSKEATAKQGTSSLNLLNWIDKGTGIIYNAGNTIPLLRWFVPFIKTPINILKQGVEYSPLGFTTIHGAKNTTEQIGKTLFGSMITLIGGIIAAQGDSTWDTPESEKQKKEFFASGRQPFALKIGDKWISYQRLGPVAYPLALASAIKYYAEQDPKRFTKTHIEKILDGANSYLHFFAKQSYVESLGDLLDAARGDADYSKVIGNLPQQILPLSSLEAWVARIIDPVYRHPSEGTVNLYEKMSAQLKANIPFVSKEIPPYTDPLGRPSERQMPFLNAFLPTRVTKENKIFDLLYQIGQDKALQSDVKNKIIKILDSGLSDEVKQKRLNNLLEIIGKNRETQ